MIHVRVIKVADPAQMGKAAADVFEAVIAAKPASILQFHQDVTLVCDEAAYPL